MASDAQPPFSARNRRDTAPIDGNFPDTARILVLHLLSEGIRRGYLEGWAAVALEIQRIARVPPQMYSRPDSSAALESVAEILKTLPWDRMYDLCERLHNYLAKEAGFTWNDEYTVTTSKREVQLFFSDELQRLFQEENLAVEFRDGLVQHRGRRHTVEQVSKAEAVLVDAQLATARKHFAKALRYFRDRAKPDPENAVKEAVCAVEAAAKDLFPNAKAKTLDDSIKWLTGPDSRKLLPKAIGQTLAGLYGFRSGGDGVGHGGSTGGAATTSIAEYALASAASQIILLVDLAKAEEDEIPF